MLASVLPTVLGRVCTISGAGDTLSGTRLTVTVVVMEDPAGARRGYAAAPHPLMIYRSEQQQRSQAARWIAEALSQGDKVFYKHNFTDTSSDPAAQWLAEAGIDPAVLESGQLELVDAERLHADTGGWHRALRDDHVERVQRAYREGYPQVAFTGDGAALHTIAPRAAELVAHERDLDRLTHDFRVRALCRYHSEREDLGLLTQMLDLHHRSVEDGLWGALRNAGRLIVSGEIDINNADRFATVLHSAVADGARKVDLAAVTLLSAAGVAILTEVADVLHEAGERLAVVGASPTTVRVLSLLGVVDHPGLDLVRP